MMHQSCYFKELLLAVCESLPSLPPVVSEFLLYRRWNVKDRQLVRKSLKFVAEKNIKAHAFSPSACWQAVLTALGGIYILPVKTLLVRKRKRREEKRETFNLTLSICLR